MCPLTKQTLICSLVSTSNYFSVIHPKTKNITRKSFYFPIWQTLLDKSWRGEKRKKKKQNKIKYTIPICNYRKVQCHSSETKIRPISWVAFTHSPEPLLLYACSVLGSKRKECEVQKNPILQRLRSLYHQFGREKTKKREGTRWKGSSDMHLEKNFPVWVCWKKKKPT